MNFSSPENQKIIEKFVEKDFSHLQEAHPPLFYRSYAIQEIVRRMGSLGQDKTECGLDTCTYNNEHRGKDFLQDMKEIAPARRGHQILSDDLEVLINGLYVDAIRFLKELELTLPAGEQLAMELADILRTARNGVRGEIADTESQYDLMQYTRTGVIFSVKEIVWWALYDMPQEIFKRKIAELRPGTVALETINNWQERTADWHKKLGSMQKDIGERQKEIEELPAKLKPHQQEYNFVGLSAGFSSLAKSLRKQKAFNALGMFGSVVAIFLWPGLAALLAFNNALEPTPLVWYLWLPIATSLATLELVSVYLFRVVLIRQKSLEAQLLQVNLRMQLCAFVESYAEFAKKIKKDAPETLKKFEDLIFSSIAMEPGQVPSAMDGMGQVAPFIQTLQASPKP